MLMAPAWMEMPCGSDWGDAGFGCTLAIMS
jgi:hypothetical protein